MTLDAHAHCCCFERGELLEQPDPAWQVFVTRDGGRDAGTKDMEQVLAFDQWDLERACPHEMGTLLHHFIGNIALVARLRHELNRYSGSFPLILQRVIQNGVHTGDWLSLEQVETLDKEIRALTSVSALDPEFEPWLRHFELQMRELVAASRSVGKPIVF